MMEIVTKFDPGDEVWTMYENKVHSFRIARIEISVRPAYMSNGNLHPSPAMREIYIEEKNINARTKPVVIRHFGFDCYATKEELISNLISS